MVELFIAVRHLKERKFQSIFSILGVAISVTVLMVSLTVSNGLEKNMLKSLLTLNPHIILTKGNGDVAEDYMDVKKKIEEINGVKGVIPKYAAQAIVKTDEYAKGVLANGMPNEDLEKTIDLKMVSGEKSLPELNSAIIGEEMAYEFGGLKVGDEIKVLTTENKEVRFKISGIFKTGYYEYDRNLLIIPLQTMQILQERGEVISEIDVMLNNPKDAESVKQKIEKLGFNYQVNTWGEQNQQLLNAVKFEKFVLVSLLLLIVIIACFAVSVILNMVVREKIRDIGILRSIGYSGKMIKKIFTIEGIIIGVCGIISTFAMVPLVLFVLDKLFNKVVSNTYYLDKLPLSITLKEIGLIYLVTIIIVYLSTLYPSYRASKLNPVEALKHE
ncbi:ABC transporter permease [Sebaldella sp. S0638]|uniref:ABC transporter permease n=1 Tax=Sebaldella sp. S0638 TaxID=2957809 RepID=UPI00209C98A1|nr:ABC transporter permease [Sebaldella sp. S0638]MCP1224843.1 ABC transporter permease [Sebaldella sp. S0638]